MHPCKALVHDFTLLAYLGDFRQSVGENIEII
jgi:hypothetical protein